MVAQLRPSTSIPCAHREVRAWSAWPETAVLSPASCAVIPPAFEEHAVDDRPIGDHEDNKEVLYLREKIIEAIRERDAQDARYLLGLSVARKLVPAFEKARQTHETHYAPWKTCNESSGWGLLHFSCSRGFLDITQLLLGAGANPLTAVDKRGKTCLHLAIEHDSQDVMKLLLNRHPVGDWPRLSKLTLGQTAARAGRTAAMQLLLRCGLDPNERGRNGETPLHYAARHGHHRVIEILLQQGADVGARERWAGRTPLHYACQGGSLKAATTLIVNAGADVHLRDFSEAEHTPLEAAVVSGHRSLSHRLVLLVENRRRADARREAAAMIAASAKRETILYEANAVKRRVMLLQGTLARKRSLVRMEKREIMDNLRAQTAKANSRLRNLEAQHERLEMRQAELNRNRPGTCPAASGAARRRPSTTRCKGNG